MADFLTTLLQQLPTAISAFSRSADPYRQQQEALAAQQAKYSAAAANPNDPLYKNLYGQYQQQNNTNLAQVIAEAQRQNRGQQDMGRTPLFSQERGGENIFRALVQGQQIGAAQADTQTRAALTGAGNLGTQAAAQYGAATPMTAAGNAQSGVLGYQALANIFSPQHSSTGNGYAGVQNSGVPAAVGGSNESGSVYDFLKKLQPQQSYYNSGSY